MTWEVDVVLDYIKRLPHSDMLTLKQLTHKLAGYVNGTSKRRQMFGFGCVRPSCRSSQGNGVNFVNPGLTKTRRKGPPLESFF